MWLGLLIATIIIVGFLSVSLWIKIYIEKGNINPVIDCAVQKKDDINSDICNHCGLKDLASCSINKLNK
jgi:hypothetical protein